MRRFNHFYGVNSYRKIKQIIFALGYIVAPILIILIVYVSWSSFWEFNMMIGYKFLAAVYLITFIFILSKRFLTSSR
jgi:hypothetical protein